MSVNGSSKRDVIITCDRLTVAYGREVVLHEVSLQVERGSFLPVVGPNGAGKTTLLRTILGLIRPRSGRVVTPFHKQPPGYVPQHTSIDPLYPVNVWQIVSMGLYPKLGWWGRPGADDRETVRAALEEVGLAEHIGKTFSELSGGMKQKALIARALVCGADVFVMDEPTANLDHESETEVIHHLHRLSAEHGKTVLLAQHALELVENLAPAVCVVCHGRARVAPTEEYVRHGAEGD